jgi:biopolymer transport protein ExbD
MSTATTTATWKVRHEGSPRSVDDLSLAQVQEGLQDGLWETTDEVMGPGETAWVPIENHPQLAEIAADIEPPPSRTYDDETRLDMNALIDVCLVLLIFFMLVTSYSVLEKRLEEPSVTEKKAGRVVTPKEAEEQMLLVTVKMEKGQPVIRLEDKVVPLEDLENAMRRAVFGTPKNELLLEFEYNVPHGTIIAVKDAASGARFTRVHYVMPDKEAEK